MTSPRSSLDGVNPQKIKNDVKQFLLEFSKMSSDHQTQYLFAYAYALEAFNLEVHKKGPLYIAEQASLDTLQDIFVHPKKVIS